MELREIKKITAYARRAGIKSLEVNGFKIELHDFALFPKAPTAKPGAPDPAIEKSTQAPDPGPTLDQINEYIYSTEDGSP